MSEVPVPVRLGVDEGLVRRLVAAQFPRWAHLPVRRAVPSGWDNQTFRLGDALSVRLPSAIEYAPAVEKEQRWLPVLAPHLPLPIPAPMGCGRPGEGYPCPWSVYGWLDGEPASVDNIGDLAEFATALADFLTALRQVDPANGPEPGLHNWFRGGPLTTYDDQTRSAIERLDGDVPAVTATAIWQAALAATWDGKPVWYHGDVAEGNLLVKDGRLAAVIDFGTCGVGDPACDMVIAWTLLRGPSRETFRRRHRVDRATWARGRGWALWKALITLEGIRESDLPAATDATRVLVEILAEWEQPVSSRTGSSDPPARSSLRTALPAGR
jgi:aminoglycoside phosphotransferase (APT) family kinase protein